MNKPKRYYETLLEIAHDVLSDLDNEFDPNNSDSFSEISNQIDKIKRLNGIIEEM